MNARSQIFVVRTLSAVHRILILGELEPLHGHDFEVTATFASELDPDEFVPHLEALLAELACSDLAQLTADAGLPSAERVARALWTQLAARGLPVLSVSLAEAPGCVASFADRPLDAGPSFRRPR